MPRRFATNFYVALLPRAAPSIALGALLSTPTTLPAATSDGTETVSATWLSPRQAITSALARVTPALSAKPLILYPPQFYLLAELAQHTDYRTLLDNTRAGGERGGAKVIRARCVRNRLVPTPRQVKDQQGRERLALVLPGDEAYDDDDDDARARRSAAEEERPSKKKKGRRNRTYIVQEEVVEGRPLEMVPMGVERKGMGEIWGEGWGDLCEGDCGQPGRDTSGSGAKRSKL